MAINNDQPPLNFETDEEWRAKVEREREEMRRTERAKRTGGENRPSGSASAGAGEQTAGSVEGQHQETAERAAPRAPEAGRKEERRVPPPDLRSFLAGLYRQTLMLLGLIENPVTKRKEADLDQAQYLIDTLELLESKMKGNLDPEEKRYFDGILFDLRMRFVEARRS